MGNPVVSTDENPTVIDSKPDYNITQGILELCDRYDEDTPKRFFCDAFVDVAHNPTDQEKVNNFQLLINVGSRLFKHILALENKCNSEDGAGRRKRSIEEISRRFRRG